MARASGKHSQPSTSQPATRTFASGTGASSPQSVSKRSPYNRRAERSSRDGSMRCGAPMSDTQTVSSGMRSHERTCCSGVIEVDVREEQVAHVGQLEAVRRETRRAARAASRSARSRTARARRRSRRRRRRSRARGRAKWRSISLNVPITPSSQSDFYRSRDAMADRGGRSARLRARCERAARPGPAARKHRSAADPLHRPRRDATNGVAAAADRDPTGRSR